MVRAALWFHSKNRQTNLFPAPILLCLGLLSLCESVLRIFFVFHGRRRVISHNLLNTTTLLMVAMVTIPVLSDK